MVKQGTNIDTGVRWQMCAIMCSVLHISNRFSRSGDKISTMQTGYLIDNVTYIINNPAKHSYMSVW